MIDWANSNTCPLLKYVWVTHQLFASYRKASQWRQCGGEAAAPGDTLNGVGDTLLKFEHFCGWNYKNTGETIAWKGGEGASGDGSIGRSLYHFWGRWPKKDHHLFIWRKEWHHQLPHRVTPTLVTPLKATTAPVKRERLKTKKNTKTRSHFNQRQTTREQDTQTRVVAPVTLTLTRWPWHTNLT